MKNKKLMLSLLMGAICFIGSDRLYSKSIRTCKNIDYALPVSFPKKLRKFHDSYTAPRVGGRAHRAYDFYASGGDKNVYAAADGFVSATFYDKTTGYAVKVKHRNGCTTMYAHLDSYEVNKGDWVNQCDRLGGIGCSGNCKRAYAMGRKKGPHLHFETRYNNYIGSKYNHASLLTSKKDCGRKRDDRIDHNEHKSLVKKITSKQSYGRSKIGTYSCQSWNWTPKYSVKVDWGCHMEPKWFEAILDEFNIHKGQTQAFYAYAFERNSVKKQSQFRLYSASEQRIKVINPAQEKKKKKLGTFTCQSWQWSKIYRFKMDWGCYVSQAWIGKIRKTSRNLKSTKIFYSYAIKRDIKAKSALFRLFID